MRAPLLLGMLLITCVGCKSDPLPGGGGGGGGGDVTTPGGDMASGTTTTPNPPASVACGEPDGTVITLAGDVKNAQKLLPGRWQACTHLTGSLGGYALPASFVGLEFEEDDSVTQNPGGGGHWYFLETAADGSIVRGSGFDGGGIFLYNPFPGPDFEQIALEQTGTSSDFNAAFSDGPRKLHLDDGASFSATFAPL